MSLVARALAPSALLQREMMQRARLFDSQLAVGESQPYRHIADRAASGPRFVMLASSLFAALALALALLGVFRTTAYIVARRQREIGVRIALGASGRDAMTAVLRDTFRSVLIGVSVGGVIALAKHRERGYGPLARSSDDGIAELFRGAATQCPAARRRARMLTFQPLQSTRVLCSRNSVWHREVEARDPAPSGRDAARLRFTGILRTAPRDPRARSVDDEQKLTGPPAGVAKAVFHSGGIRDGITGAQPVTPVRRVAVQHPTHDGSVRDHAAAVSRELLR